MCQKKKQPVWIKHASNLKQKAREKTSSDPTDDKAEEKSTEKVENSSLDPKATTKDQPNWMKHASSLKQKARDKTPPKQTDGNVEKKSGEENVAAEDQPHWMKHASNLKQKARKKTASKKADDKAEKITTQKVEASSSDEPAKEQTAWWTRNLTQKSPEENGTENLNLSSSGAPAKEEPARMKHASNLKQKSCSKPKDTTSLTSAASSASSAANTPKWVQRAAKQQQQSRGSPLEGTIATPREKPGEEMPWTDSDSDSDDDEKNAPTASIGDPKKELLAILSSFPRDDSAGKNKDSPPNTPIQGPIVQTQR
jgi:hypothetical protein